MPHLPTALREARKPSKQKARLREEEKDKQLHAEEAGISKTSSMKTFSAASQAIEETFAMTPSDWTALCQDRT